VREPQGTSERRSIRRYRAEPVAPSLVREALIEGRWAPSATNTQSTAVYVLTGEALERARAALRECLFSGCEPSADLPPAASLPEPYLSRRNSLFATRSAFVAANGRPEQTANSPAAGVANRAEVANMEFFGAPVVLVFALDRRLPTGYACFDAGLFVQNVALASHARGLGTCVMTSPLRFAAALHSLLPGSDEQDLVAVMALGYPDGEAAVNRFPRERIPIDEFVTFLD
jgi:nitroreductase